MPRGPGLNVANTSENVTEIERQIRVTKERTRSIIHSLPFNKAPKLFLTDLLFQEITMLNHSPVKGGISDIIRPTSIMIGESLN